MSANNAFFKISDLSADEICGYPIDKAWWSRGREYPWAFQFAAPGQHVADMGCGWMPRPFKDALADVCKHVYAVDIDSRLLEQPNVRTNLTYVIDDFTQSMNGLPMLDTIFCISVLEDIQQCVDDALINFASQLKRNGRMVLTFDVPYDDNKPCPRYPGMPLDLFDKMLRRAKLEYDGDVDVDKTDAIFHQDFNLTVFHGVLKHAGG